MVTPEPREEKWNDFIQEFWENHLPHFRRHGYVYRTVSPSASHASDYPENTESSSKILDELFRCSSETNILTTIAEEELTSESSSVVEQSLVDDGETIDMWCIIKTKGEKPFFNKLKSCMKPCLVFTTYCSCLIQLLMYNTCVVVGLCSARDEIIYSYVFSMIDPKPKEETSISSIPKEPVVSGTHLY